MNDYLKQHNKKRKLTSLVENRTSYNSNYAELNIFETYTETKNYYLKFDTPIIASMLTGKKIMHIKDMPSFNFEPGESVVVPSNQELLIDFPNATSSEPTKCLALTIDPNKINEIAQNFNEAVAIENENNNWSLNKTSSHLKNQKEVDFLIKRLIQTFTNNTKSKDMLLDIMIQELIVRLLQTKAKQSILNDVKHLFSDTRIGTVVKFIHKNLTDKKLSIKILANKAHMSVSHFHKIFKDTLGISPIDYINSERIKFSKKIIARKRDILVTDVAFKSGFNSVSYFNRQFKKQELIKPSQYRKLIQQNNL